MPRASRYRAAVSPLASSTPPQSMTVTLLPVRLTRHCPCPTSSMAKLPAGRAASAQERPMQHPVTTTAAASACQSRTVPGRSASSKTSA